MNSMTRVSRLTLWVLSLFFTGNGVVSGQGWCDSTLLVCDSITIDSVLISHHPVNGDRVHFFMKTEHEFLHGPVFLACPDNRDIEFKRNPYLFSGLPGPRSFNTYYEFSDFTTVGDTLEGYIHMLGDGGSGTGEACYLYFKVAIPGPITDLKEEIYPHNSDIQIFPNPLSDIARMQSYHSTSGVRYVRAYNAQGQEHSIPNNNGLLDMSSLKSGLWILRIGFGDGYESIVNVIKK